MTLRPQRWSGRPGESVAVDVRCFGVDGERSDGVLDWQAGDAAGQLDATAGQIEVPLAGPGMVTLDATWLDADGAAIATNRIELACVAATAGSQALTVVGDSALAATLRTLGYAVSEASVEAAAPGTILVARRYDTALERAVQSGARLLLLAGEPGDGEQPMRLPVGAVIPRAGTSWQGDWATAFSWIKKQGPFATLPGDPLLEMEYEPVMPDAILVGLPPWAYATHCWAGPRAGLDSQAGVAAGRDALRPRPRRASRPSSSTRQTLAEDAVAQALFAGAIALLS